MYPPEENLRSGYLQQNFRLFHLKDKKEQQFDFHYHDFDKIVIFLSGNVTYIVEGKSYHLKPWDIAAKEKVCGYFLYVKTANEIKGRRSNHTI